MREQQQIQLDQMDWVQNKRIAFGSVHGAAGFLLVCRGEHFKNRDQGAVRPVQDLLGS